MDWRKHQIGPGRACIVCRRRALMRDELGRPCHKVCAEGKGSELLRSP